MGIPTTIGIVFAWGLGGIALWASSLWFSQGLFRGIQVATRTFPQFARIWFLAFPLLSLCLVAAAAIFNGIALLPNAGREVVGYAFLVLAAATIVAFAWALIPRLPMPPFLDPGRLEQAAQQRRDNYPLEPDDTGAVTIKSARPVGAILSVIGLSALSAVLLGNTHDRVGFIVAAGFLIVFICALALLIVSWVKVTGLRLDNHGLVDRTTLAPHDLTWGQVVAIEPTGLGVLVKIQDSQTLVTTSPTYLRRLVQAELRKHQGFVISTFQLPLSPGRLAEFMSDYWQDNTPVNQNQEPA